MSVQQARLNVKRDQEELKQVDFHENKSSSAKPSIAQKLEKESQELQKRRSSLNKDEVDSKLKEAEERRQSELQKKIETAKELEGEKGRLDRAAAARDAPPQGKELPYSPVAQDNQQKQKK